MAGITVQLAKRLQQLPPYLFAELDRMKQAALERGVDIIHLGVGDPDRPTPPEIIDALKLAAEKPEHHRYPSYIGMRSFRQAVADWYAGRFGVSLDADREVISLIGSKEGIAHVTMGFVNPGDVVLIPDPCYPVYPAATVFAGGVPVYMPLLAKNDFLVDFEAIDPQDVRRATMMYLNYPNNPTAACAPEGFFQRAIAFAKQHNIIICHDNAYSEIYYDGQQPLSFMEIDGAREVGVEFHSLSKTFNMTGWRIGFAVGNADVIAGLGTVKTNIDSGIFQAIQEAGIVALENVERIAPKVREIYQGRRDVLFSGLQDMGFELAKPMAGFYLWIKTPAGYASSEFTAKVLEETGIVSTPGVGFGAAGEGYVRMTLTVDEARLAEAIERLRKINF